LQFVAASRLLTDACTRARHRVRASIPDSRAGTYRSRLRTLIVALHLCDGAQHDLALSLRPPPLRTTSSQVLLTFAFGMNEADQRKTGDAPKRACLAFISNATTNKKSGTQGQTPLLFEPA
jgi:hypothetical protein